MTIKYFFLITFSFSLISCTIKSDNCEEVFVTQNMHAFNVSFGIPSVWTFPDSSYIVSHGLIESKRYFSPDSSEFFLNAVYDYTNYPMLFDTALIIMKQKGFIDTYSKTDKPVIEEIKNVTKDSFYYVLRSCFHDAVLKKEICISIITIAKEGKKFIEMTLRTAAENRKEAVRRMKCIIKSINPTIKIE